MGTSANTAFDVVVIGAGMAGASVAAHLAPHARVVMLEQEEAPGYHATGRSAALFSEVYGGEIVRRLSRASRDFLFDPPTGFSETPLVTPRDTVFLVTAEQDHLVDAFLAPADLAVSTEILDATATARLLPILKPRYAVRSLIHRGSADIDVDAVHRGFLRRFARAAGRVVGRAAVTRIEWVGGSWIVTTPQGRFAAPIVVNAAGAWADEIAAQAGVSRLGLQPMRRTAILVDAPRSLDPRPWPMTIDLEERFYFKPDAGLVLVSPADETPMPPCDAQPDEYDVAVAVDYFEQASGSAVAQVKRRWAGLRTFAADRSPVVGFDAQAAGFFWLAGQGGYGIQTAPALGELAAALVLQQALPDFAAVFGITRQALAPDRASLVAEIPT